MAAQRRLDVVVDDKNGRKMAETATHLGSRNRAGVLEAHLHHRGAAGDGQLGHLDAVDDGVQPHCTLTRARAVDGVGRERVQRVVEGDVEAAGSAAAARRVLAGDAERHQRLGRRRERVVAVHGCEAPGQRAGDAAGAGHRGEQGVAVGDTQRRVARR